MIQNLSQWLSESQLLMKINSFLSLILKRTKKFKIKKLLNQPHILELFIMYNLQVTLLVNNTITYKKYFLLTCTCLKQIYQLYQQQKYKLQSKHKSQQLQNSKYNQARSLILNISTSNSHVSNPTVQLQVITYSFIRIFELFLVLIILASTTSSTMFLSYHLQFLLQLSQIYCKFLMQYKSCRKKYIAIIKGLASLIYHLQLNRFVKSIQLTCFIYNFQHQPIRQTISVINQTYIQRVPFYIFKLYLSFILHAVQKLSV
eukprot:TRINITY_DN9335_c0_g1_i1.p2 TRINITY_DN9335_c0_g1~~TRINITY_DN9335_c0_g1_i1.p2  ORF type:complete len:259 (-),score=-36.72 TRINITY_DN9335_c0_g1_i1:285-1061(-)